MSNSLDVAAYVGLGSNLAEPASQLRRAVQAMVAHPAIDGLQLSPLYGSAPLGGPTGQPDYVNAVAAIRTRLAPHALLDFLQSVELAHGRERSVRWAARTLDLDLLLYDGQVIEDDRLTVPHPRLHERLFVLKPLADVAPALRLPNGGDIAALLAKRRAELTVLDHAAVLWPLATAPLEVLAIF